MKTESPMNKINLQNYSFFDFFCIANSLSYKSKSDLCTYKSTEVVNIKKPKQMLLQNVCMVILMWTQMA